MTTFTLTDDEWALLENLPLDNLVELAADLDLVIPAEIDRRALVEACIPRIVDRGQAQGLPLSKYDRDDLEALDPQQLAALAAVQGSRPTVGSVLKAGQKAYRQLDTGRTGHDPFAIMIPILLGPIVRHAVDRGLT